MSESTEDILPRLHDGDPRAAEECIDRYGGLVWSLARRYHATTADAEDAVQEVFLALWKNAERFDPEVASETTFVAMIARRRLIDLLRKRKRRIDTTGLDGKSEQIPGVRGEQVEAVAEAALAARALATLDEKERRVVVLSTCHGMSHGQIARHTGLPLGTVKTYVRRGLERVRAALGDRRSGGTS